MIINHQVLTSTIMKNTPLFLLALLFFGSMMSLRAIPMERNKPETKRLDQSLRRDHERAATGESSAAGAEALPRVAEGSQFPSEHIGEAFAGASDEVASTQTSLNQIINPIEPTKLLHLVDDFLISNPQKRIEGYAGQYSNVLEELRGLNAPAADTINAAALPKTKDELTAFETMCEGLIRTNALGNADLIEQFNKHFTQLYGLKVALNVLDAAKEHRNRFLRALENPKAPEAIVAEGEDSAVSKMSCFYHQQINNVDKTIQNLQRAAASILQTVESINDHSEFLRITNRRDEDEDIIDCLKKATGHALASMLRNTQYVEAVRAGKPAAARGFVQQAELFSSAMECGIRANQARAGQDGGEVVNMNASELYRAARDFFNTAAGAKERGNEELAALWIQSASCCRSSAEATIAQNEALARRWGDAGLYFGSTVQAKERGNEELATLWIQAANCYRDAAEATIDQNETLARLWTNAGTCFSVASEAKEIGNEELAALWIQAASYFRSAAEATHDGNESSAAVSEAEGNEILARLRSS